MLVRPQLSTYWHGPDSDKAFVIQKYLNKTLKVSEDTLCGIPLVEGEQCYTQRGPTTKSRTTLKIKINMQENSCKTRLRHGNAEEELTEFSYLSCVGTNVTKE